MVSEGPFRYDLEKFSRQYTSITSNQPPPQWTHISQPSIIILKNMFPIGVINGGAGEPVLKVVSIQNVLLESLNVSYRYADSLKAKALLKSPTIGIRYNHTVLDNNGMPSSQETRKIQLRFKNIDDFESCASIIGRYITCKRMDCPKLSSNSELGINSQENYSSTNRISQFQTNTTTYNNNMELNRVQREPSVTPIVRTGQHRQQIISSQNLRSQTSNKQSLCPSTAPSSSSHTTSSQNSVIQIDESRSKLQQHSQSNFNNNDIQQFQNNNKLLRFSDGKLTNDAGLHQFSIRNVQNQNQKVDSNSIRSNDIISQSNSQNNFSPHMNNRTELRSYNDTRNEYSQEPIFYPTCTNNQDIINSNAQKIIITQNERDEPSYTSNGQQQMSVSPHENGTHKTPLASNLTQVQLRDQFSRQLQQPQQYQTQLQTNTNARMQQNLQVTQKINIVNGQEHIARNNLDVSITPDNKNNTKNTIIRSSNTSNTTNTIMTSNQLQSSQIQQRQFLKNQNGTNYSQPQSLSKRIVSTPQTFQKNMSQDVSNLHLPCTSPNQITFNSIHLPPVQQVNIKQEKLDIPPMQHIKEHCFIDLTMSDDDDSFEFDSQPAQVIPHMQERQISNSQPINSDQPRYASTYSTLSSVMQISPQNTCFINDGSQNLRNRNQPLSTIHNNSTCLSGSSIQKQNIPLPDDDAELQDWIVNILKDPNFPQFVSRVEKLWKARILAYDL